MPKAHSNQAMARILPGPPDSITVAVLKVFVAVVLLSPSSLSAFQEFARGELLLHTRTFVTYDSNVFAEEDGKEDFVFGLNPELQYVRQAGRGDLSAQTGIVLARHLDFNDGDYEDFYVILAAGYPVSPTSPFSGGAEASFRQDSTINESLNQRTRADRLSVNLSNNYRLNPRIGLNNSFRYTHSNTRGFSEVESFGGSFGSTYFHSENLGFNITYRIRRTTSTGRTRSRQDNLNQAVTTGATGQLTTRVSGNISVGVQNTQILRGDGSDRNRIVFATGLDWAARPNTTMSLDGERDIDLSPEDRTIERTSIRIGLNQRLNPKISANLGAGYRLSEFSGLTSDRDHTYLGTAGLSYGFTQRWSAALDYAFNHTDSERRDQKFDRHTVTLSTSYTF